LLTDPRRSFGIWSIFALALTAGLILEFRGGMTVDTNILSMLPETERDPVIAEATDRFTRDMSSRTLFLLSGAHVEATESAAASIEDALRRSDLFTDVVGKITESTERTFYDLYFPYRYQLLAEPTRARLGESEDGAALIREAQKVLYSPMSSVYARMLPDDPLLLFADFVHHMPDPPGDLKPRNNWLSVREAGTYHIFLSATSGEDAFARDGQQRAQLFLTGLRAELRAAHPDVDLAMTGVIRYAADAARKAETEASTIGFGSFAGVMLLFLLVFRGLRPLVLGALPILVGLLAATVVCFGVFERVHLLTLGFGASLIGICIDYTFHFFCHRLGQEEPSQTFPRKILPAVTLGALTSIMGYLGLLSAPFPGLRQMALFSIVGLLGAFATVLLAFPWLSAGWQSEGLRPRALAASYLRIWNRMSRATLIVGGLVLVAVIALGMMRLETADDIRNLGRPSPDLLREEERIREVAGGVDTSRFLLVEGNSPEEVLRREEALRPGLEALKEQGVLELYQNISRFVPSAERQRRNHELLREKLADGVLDGYLEEMGFTPEIADRARRQIEEAPTDYLTVEAWLDHPASDQMRSLWLGETARGYAAMTVLGGLTDLDALAPLAVDEHVHYIDKVAAITGLMQRYRVLAAQLAAFSYLAIYILLIWRYGFGRGTLVMLPPVAAALTALAILGLLGLPVNLFHILALLLVLGIGIDYTIFFAESGTEDTTMLAVMMSATTTVLSFGLLGLSTTPVLESLGLTVLFGMAAAFALSPLAGRGR